MIDLSPNQLMALILNAYMKGFSVSEEGMNGECCGKAKLKEIEQDSAQNAKEVVEELLKNGGNSK